MNFWEWIAKHSTVPEGTFVTNGSCWMQSAYDSSFAYEQGDTTSPRTAEKPLLGRPTMGTGTVLRGALRLGLGYKGAMAWKFQTGCGEALVAPLYEVLRRRGVKFEFFSKVEHLGVATTTARHRHHPDSAAGRSRPSAEGLPAAHRRQRCALLAGRAALGSDRQRRRGSRNGSRIGLDSVAAASSPAPFAAASISITCCWRSPSGRCRRFAANSSRRARPGKPWWTRSRRCGRRRSAVGQSGSRKPRLDGSKRARGYRRRADGHVGRHGSVHRSRNVAGGRHSEGRLVLLLRDAGRSKPALVAGRRLSGTQLDAVRETSINFLTISRHSSGRAHIHRTGSTGGCSSRQLARPVTRAAGRTVCARRHRRLGSLRALPARQRRHRLKPGESGFRNLTLAGDWTENTINAGCMEATVMSGLAASRAIAGYPERIVGEDDFGAAGPRRATVKSG